MRHIWPLPQTGCQRKFPRIPKDRGRIHVKRGPGEGSMSQMATSISFPYPYHLSIGDDAFRARDVKATIYLMASTHIEIVHELQLLQKKTAYAPVGLAKAVASVEHT